MTFSSIPNTNPPAIGNNTSRHPPKPPTIPTSQNNEAASSPPKEREIYQRLPESLPREESQAGPRNFDTSRISLSRGARPCNCASEDRDIYTRPSSSIRKPRLPFHSRGETLRAAVPPTRDSKVGRETCAGFLRKGDASRLL